MCAWETAAAVCLREESKQTQFLIQLHLTVLKRETQRASSMKIKMFSQADMSGSDLPEIAFNMQFLWKWEVTQ